MYDVSVGKFDRKGTWGFVKEDISNPLSLFLHVVVCLYERKYADFITFNQKVHQSRKQQDQMTSKIFLCSTFFVMFFLLEKLSLISDFRLQRNHGFGVLGLIHFSLLKGFIDVGISYFKIAQHILTCLNKILTFHCF